MKIYPVNEEWSAALFVTALLQRLLHGAQRIFVLLLLVYLAEQISAGEAEGNIPAEAEEIVSSLLQSGDNIGKLKDFEASGSSTLELSPELARNLGQGNIVKGTFHLVVKQPLMKLTIVRENGDGTQRVVEFFTDSSQSVTISTDTKGVRAASVVKGSELSANHGHPVFANYGFIFPGFDGDDLIAPNVRMLADRACWNAVSSRIQKVQSLADGGFKMNLRLTGDQFSEVQLSRLEPPNGGVLILVPNAISRFDAAGVVQSKLEATDWLWDPLIGPIAREIVLTTDPDGKNRPTWRRLTMKIDSWKTAGAITAEDVAFDPSSVDVIHDSESSARIDVPR